MFRTLLTTSAIACALSFGIPAGNASLSEAGQFGHIGKATKDVGSDVAKGTTDVAKKTGEVTKDAAKKTATETKNVGKTAEGAVTPGVGATRCKDGTVHTAKTKTEACTGHGGVK